MGSFEKSKFNLSQNFAFEACGLIYRRWTEEYDLLKKVREEKNDRSSDWEELHAIRLQHHTNTEAYWSKLKDEAGLINHTMMYSGDCENLT